METRIAKIEAAEALGHFRKKEDGTDDLDCWEVSTAASPDMDALREAASLLRTSDIPVGFPTETVYGLGADATRSAAVRGIFAAKGRPSDNPLIVHVSDLSMLRALLSPPAAAPPTGATTNGTTTTTTTTTAAAAAAAAAAVDPIPAIYRPLIARFWPGPLTILLANPPGSRLAAEVTAGQPAFGARLPASALARSLIALAAAPLAAPSANASTRPSPTAAAHVVHDLRGRVALVLDGGACAVGLESTVVDGLCDPPAVLRPGGVSEEALRACPGWGALVRAYRDDGAGGAKGEAPRAPGMKYKHYSPRARVVLFEAGRDGGGAGEVVSAVEEAARAGRRIGVVRTRGWEALDGVQWDVPRQMRRPEGAQGGGTLHNGDWKATYELREGTLDAAGDGGQATTVLDLNLGRDIRSIAQGLFSALRDLDEKGADVIFIEGIGDREDIAAAVMNRLRKAASEIRP